MSGNAGFDTCLFYGGGRTGAFHNESLGLDEAVQRMMSHHLLPSRRIHCASDTYEVWAAEALTELCRNRLVPPFGSIMRICWSGPTRGRGLVIDLGGSMQKGRFYVAPRV